MISFTSHDYRMANTDSTKISPRLSPCNNSSSPEQGSPRNNNEQSLHILVEPQPDGLTNLIYLVNPLNGVLLTTYMAENGACIQIQPGVNFRVPFPQEHVYRSFPPHQLQQPSYPPNVVPCGMQIPGGGMYMPRGANDYYSPRCPVHGSPSQQANGCHQEDHRLERRREKLQRKFREKQSLTNQTCSCLFYDQSQSKPPKNQGRREMKMNGHEKSDVTPGTVEGTDGNDVDVKDTDDDIPVLTAPITLVKDGVSIQLSWADCVANNSHLSSGQFELEMASKGANFRSIYCGADVEYLVENLRPATDYSFRLRVIIDGKRGKYSDIATASTPCIIPNPPSLPKVTHKTKTTLLIKWNPPFDGGSVITAYSLQWNNGKPKSEFEEIYKGAQRQYKLSHKLPPSTPCKFRLQAINSVGWSDYSPVLECMTGFCPPETPDQPQLLKSTSVAIMLKWTEPKDNGAPISEYRLEMEDDRTGYGFKSVYCGENKQFTCKGLNRDTVYKFRLLATNVAGSSKYSPVVSCKTLPEAPGKMAKPRLVGKAKTHTFTLTWDPPKDTGGPEISSYILEMCEGNGSEFNEVYRGIKPEFTQTGLSPGRTYKVRVFAIGNGGKSVPSAVADITTMSVCPCKPDVPRLSSKHRQESTILFLEWDSPEDDGGSTITSYLVKMQRPNEEDDTFQDVYEGSRKQCNVLGLQPGQKYLFKIQAVNKAGASPWSDIAELHTAPGSPDAPETITCYCKSPTHLRLEWSEPLVHGSPVTGYTVEQLQDEVFRKIYDGKSTFCEVRKGLQPATSYFFRVQAHSDAGSSSFSPVCTGKTLPASPAAVTFVKVLDQTSASALLQWKHPNNHGASISHYTLEISGTSTSTLIVPMKAKHDTCSEDEQISVDDESGSICSSEEQIMSSKDSRDSELMQFNVTDLLADTAYRIRIQAVNRIGSGPFSHPVQLVTKELPPSPPKLELISSSHQSLKLKWGESVSPRRNNLGLNFTLQMKKKSDLFTTIFTGMGQSFSVSKLKELTAYTFRISAKNDAGDGSFSEPKTFYTKPQPPSAIKDLTWKKLSDTSASVSWHALDLLRLDDGMNYIVQRMQADQSKEFSEVYRGPKTEVIFNDLMPDQEYHVRVHAIRSLSDSLRTHAPNVPSFVKGPMNSTLRLKISQETSTETPIQPNNQQMDAEEPKVTEVSDTQVALLILGILLCVGLIAALTLWFFMGEIKF